MYTSLWRTFINTSINWAGYPRNWDHILDKFTNHNRDFSFNIWVKEKPKYQVVISTWLLASCMDIIVCCHLPSLSTYIFISATFSLFLTFFWTDNYKQPSRQNECVYIYLCSCNDVCKITFWPNLSFWRTIPIKNSTEFTTIESMLYWAYLNLVFGHFL